MPKPTTIDEYLANVSEDKRAALEELRTTIRRAAPKAEECISYQLPAFRLDGMLVGFGATAKHCAFYLMSSSMVETHREDLAGYDTSKGTIRFQPEKPLPAALVRKLVKARIAENKALRAAPEAKRSSTRGAVRTDPAVDQFMRQLEHPMKEEIESVRRIILGASPEVGEGIKWNAPSFHTAEYFATIHLRTRDAVQIIFHLGAKARKGRPRPAIDDPAGLLTWLGDDRCTVKLGSAKEIASHRAALERIVREWIGYL